MKFPAAACILAVVLEGCDKKLPEAAELIKKAAKGPDTNAPGTKP